jgi:hypothetical protein
VNNTQSLSTKIEARFASDLGWKPGQWPSSLQIDGNPFAKSHSIISDGELVGWIYHDVFGKEVMIYND